MNQSFLLTQGQRAIHTPAIFDFGAPGRENRTRAGFAGSTGSIQAVHIRGPLFSPPSVYAAYGAGSRP